MQLDETSSRLERGLAIRRRGCLARARSSSEEGDGAEGGEDGRTGDIYIGGTDTNTTGKIECLCIV